jgi:hypothetical protein
MRLLGRLLIGTFLLQYAAMSPVAGRVPEDNQALGWSTYVTPRFGTTVTLPTGIFMPAGSPEKGVGQRFSTPDGHSSISIYALDNKLGDSPAIYLARNLRVENSAIEYKRITRSFFAISMEHNGMVYYSRCNFVRQDIPSIHCFDLQYPQQEKRSWDAVVTRISLSLRPLESRYD